MNYLFFDTEATDLISNTAMSLEKQPRVFEFCGILADENQNIVHQYESHFNPGVEITEEARRITGVNPDMLKSKPSFANEFKNIYKLINLADAVVAHNLSYDYQLLSFEAQRLGKKLPWPKIRICTVENTIHLKGYRLSLKALHRHLFNEDFDLAHRARNDVEALMRCFYELRATGEIA